MFAGQPVRSAMDTVVWGDEMLIGPAGELDLAMHDRLRAALASAAQLNLTIDFAEVRFVDVATITLFVRAASQRTAAGHRTVIINCPPQVRRVFWLARAQHLLAP